MVIDQFPLADLRAKIVDSTAIIDIVGLMKHGEGDIHHAATETVSSIVSHGKVPFSLYDLSDLLFLEDIRPIIVNSAAFGSMLMMMKHRSEEVRRAFIDILLKLVKNCMYLYH